MSPTPTLPSKGKSSNWAHSINKKIHVHLFCKFTFRTYLSILLNQYHNALKFFGEIEMQDSDPFHCNEPRHFLLINWAGYSREPKHLNLMKANIYLRVILSFLPRPDFLRKSLSKKVCDWWYNRVLWNTVVSRRLADNNLSSPFIMSLILLSTNCFLPSMVITFYLFFYSYLFIFERSVA